MKIYNAEQIRAWDAYTIEQESISSVQLMNQAAHAFTDWLVEHYPDSRQSVCVLAGTGNNGGDGLAVARLLHRRFYGLKVFVCDFSGKRSADFEAQRVILPDGVDLVIVQQIDQLPVPGKNELIIDALFGTGLDRPLTTEPWTQLIDYLNALPNDIVAIDLPSGLFADRHSDGAVVKAGRTFSFERPKYAFFFPEKRKRISGVQN